MRQKRQNQINQKERRQKERVQKERVQKERVQKERNPKEKNQKVCPVSSKCGGCRWIQKSYQEQLEAKSTFFRKLMEPYCRPEPIIAMEEPAHYRNKVHAVFGEDRRHNAISGIYEEKSHRIVPVDSCFIENQKADEIIVSIRGLLKSFKIRPYNEDTGFGLLRHVLVRVGHATGQIMVVLVLSSPILPSKNNFVKALLKLHPEITTMVLNVNDKDTSMILGERERIIYGKGYIEDRLCGKTFQISPGSFYQVNPVQAEKLYIKAMEYAGLTGTERVLDAYCGTGTIGMIAAGHAGEVIGVELNRDAVRDAARGARQNEIKNIHFYRNDAGDFLLEMAEQGEKLDVLLMDPPRSGSSEAFLNAAVKIGPERIVYISCNPETLVRDLRLLTKQNYRVEKAVAVDMFPFTDSVEAVVQLLKK
ncbi:MAG: 23S rRNA (uracil(1939)-C(5))-methyltransferase RlmD [Lachnospiraceae bacterium]|nr:23S rRNA (uracil(1939)-C(5))-methyltransferase RlmD [uncultured Acetatifactor sp.]MCI8286161.1 23S rRNA (uracil(1939)-C(5))-methyltransferase RlmD [Lachnospiraceae bacterium]